MKTQFKWAFVILGFCLIYACTEEALQSNEIDEAAQEVLQWKPEDGIRKFIPQEYLDNIPAEDLEFTERLLRNPKEKMLEMRGSEIHIAAGTTNKLAGAIAAASFGDRIVLDPGDHYETGTVAINKPVYIEGYGASLIFSNTADDPTFANFVPAIHIKQDGCLSTIRGITFKGADPVPGLCIFIDSTKSVKIIQNKFENWIYGIFTYSSDNLIIAQNKLDMNTGWQTGAIFESEGISMSDGKHCQLIENEVSGGLFGIWSGGSQGLAMRNNTHHCLEGLILCKVPAGAYNLGGRTLHTQGSTSRWVAIFNRADNNIADGIIVIDGAHHNFLDHNLATNNGDYDLEMTGDTYRFGFLTPKSFDNRAFASPGMRVKDCGLNNKLVGGTVVEGPCN